MFARTERLMLRPGWIEDAPALAHAIGDEAVVRNLARAPWPYGVRDAEAFLRDGTRHGPLPDLLIFARTWGSPRLVGGIGLTPTAAGEAELGYWIARPYWGLGFATEAGRAVVALAHQSLRVPRLTAHCHLDNPASSHVLRKLGFTVTGRVSMRACHARGGLVPSAGYAREDDAILIDTARAPRLAA
ncbi:GNAT family N-acetyltransferase [Sphingomonas solaris]|uniref:GNAT family N-acetyltransferase n=1 Tax=Alterirhizorhabdus solaris TaxID=2529389 RepID=A0A558R9I3_9SPHN|nr:GNAT family N-acetyltransferase [Sphingomonas solaris]TVV76047.1 GNAT family N-acetyltransferase [Sphingomonas solaris]